MEQIYGLTDFLDQEANNFDVFYVQYLYIERDKWFRIEKQVLSHKKPYINYSLE